MLMKRVAKSRTGNRSTGRAKASTFRLLDNSNELRIPVRKSELLAKPNMGCRTETVLEKRDFIDIRPIM